MISSAVKHLLLHTFVTVACINSFKSNIFIWIALYLIFLIAIVVIVAKDKQLPKLHYVLYPRPAGFQLCLSEARRRKAVLHDLTIAYVDHIQGKRTSEVDFLLGKFDL